MAVDRPVISDRFPFVNVLVTVGSFDRQREALLDTGFDGFLALPGGSLPIGQVPDNYLQWTLADGSEITTPAYLGSVRIGSSEVAPAVVIALGDEAIVGLRVMGRFKVTLDHGRQVVFEV